MFWLTKFFTKGKSVKDAIKYFHTINGRPPSGIETIRIKNAFMEQNRGANVVPFPKDRITNPFEPRPGDVKKIKDEDPTSAMYDRHIKEVEGIDKNLGLGFYREMGDIMRKHRREELELEYDTMFNKILEKAKRIERDPKVLLEAELGQKITGKETTTQLLEIFKNRPKKASGGRIGYAAGKIVKGGKWVIKNLERALKELAEGTYQKGLGPMEKEAFKWEIKGLIGRIRMGEPIPEDMIKTMRQDPRFKDIVKTRSTDPDLYEMEDVILNYGKKGDVSDQTIKEITGEVKDVSEKMILDDFDVTGQTKHADGGRIGMMYGGDPGFAFEYGGSWADWHDQHRDQMPVEQYIKTKLPKHRLPFREMQSGGLAYMLGEPTYMKYGVGGSVGHAPWHKPTGHKQPEAQQETPTPHVAGTPDPLKAPRGIPSLAPKNMDPAYMQQQMMQKAMMGRGNTGQGPRTMANEGGRIGFKLGGIDKGRRAFMKWLAGIMGTGVAAGTGLLKLGKAAKVAKPAAAVTETIIESNAAGMPAWFPSLVRRVLKEGKDETAKLGTIERQTVHTAKTPEGTPIQVTRDLTTDDIIVDIGEQTKHGWSSGRHGQPVRLELKKGEWVETPVIKEGKVVKGHGKGVKTKDEFTVEEAEFTGGHPENVKFEETVQFNYGDHGSDFSEIEQYATKQSSFSGESVGEVSRAQRREGWRGKKEQARQLALDKKYGGLKSTYKKDPHVRGKQADKDAWAEGRAESQAEEFDEFASGGLAGLLGE